MNIKHTAPRVSVDNIVVNKDDEILLGKVSEKWQEGGKFLWGLPGREVSFGEDLRTCAERNLRDETGLNMMSGQVVCVNSNFGYGNHYISIGILIVASGNLVNMCPDDWLEWRWFKKTDIPNRLFPSAEKTLRAFLGGVLSLDFEQVVKQGF